MAKKGLNIYKRKDGRWEGRYKNGYTPAGKAKYSSIYGKSYSAVREQLEKKRVENHSGVACSCKCTVGEIIDKWLSDVRNKVKVSTFANYTMKIQKHILPCFAGIKYDRLTADVLNIFIEQKCSEKLSAKYVSDIVILLKSAAKFAQKRYGYANRIDCVTLPKSNNTAENKFLSVSEQSHQPVRHIALRQGVYL